MRLQDCVFEIDVIRTRSPIVARPRPEWLQARDERLIPESLYRLYVLADLFSWGSAPPYLDDPRKRLFSYLGGLAEGMLISLTEIRDLLQEYGGYEDEIPTPQACETEAGREVTLRQTRTFRYLMVAQTGILDMFAEVIALLLTGQVPNLQVGRADFDKIRDFLRADLPAGLGLVTPKRHFSEMLHAALRPLVICTGAEEEWWEMACLYRNKYAHLGLITFPIWSLHDREGRLYSFLPNHWPLIMEEHYDPAGTGPHPNAEQAREIFEGMLIHQDRLEYLQGLHRRVFDVIREGLGILCDAYEQLRESEVNEEALRHLQQSERRPSFRYFEEGGRTVQGRECTQ